MVSLVGAGLSCQSGRESVCVWRVSESPASLFLSFPSSNANTALTALPFHSTTPLPFVRECDFWEIRRAWAFYKRGDKYGE